MDTKRRLLILSIAVAVAAATLAYVMLSVVWKADGATQGRTTMTTRQGEGQHAAEVGAQPSLDIRGDDAVVPSTPADLTPPIERTRVRLPEAGSLALLTEAQLPMRDRIADLEHRAAAGDAEAARELGRDLYQCANYFRDLARMDVATGDYPRAEHAQEATQLADAETFLNRNEARAKACEGLTPAQVDQWPSWLEQAALAGDDAAASLLARVGMLRERQLDFVRNPQELVRFRDAVRGSLESSASRCFAPSIASLSGSYQYGMYTAVDPARAYGYGIVSDWAEGVDPSVSPFREALRNSLTQVQFNQAVDFARRYYDRYCR